MADQSESGSRRLQSVEQAFAVMAFLDEAEGATLSETAEALDMPPSTAHIHLGTLVETGYVVRKGKVYDCSFRFLERGGRMRDEMALFQAAKPEIDDLQEQTDEHTNITVEEDGYSVQLYKSHSQQSIDDDAPLGDHLYLHTTATGKAILSELSTETVEGILGKRGMPARTDDTITDRETLFEELETIRERDYSINRGEHFPGVAAIGTAIVSEPDDAIGAISISGPLSRMGPERVEEDLAPALMNKKNIIELKLKRAE